LVFASCSSLSCSWTSKVVIINPYKHCRFDYLIKSMISNLVSTWSD
jgi:hypothetical protein